MVRADEQGLAVGISIRKISHSQPPKPIAMQAYLAAHDSFVAWLDSLTASPDAAEVDKRLWTLALCAADRGMTSVHWTFVVDGLVAHVNRKYPEDFLLASNVARGFDLSTQWDNVKALVAKARAG